MYQQFYANNPLLFWPLVGLVIFVVSFAAVLFYVFYGLRDRRKVAHLAALPLVSDEGTSASGGESHTAEGVA